MHNYVFNGDADGLCALQQLRLAGPRAAAQGEQGEKSEALITGVKRDIALLDRVRSVAGDTCTVLDVSLDVNRAGLVALLAGGVSVRYFDHHFAGDIPAHPALDAHIDLSPNVCTSLIVDRTLEGRFRRWAIVGAYGDSMTAEADALAREAGIAPEADGAAQGAGHRHQLQRLRRDHRGPARPSGRAGRRDAAVRRSAAVRGRLGGLQTTGRRHAEMTWSSQSGSGPRARRRARSSSCSPTRRGRAAPAARSPTTRQRRTAAAPSPSCRPKTEGGFLVSVRVPRDFSVSAEAFCRRFPTGGGRKTAAGINHLPSEELESFTSAFEQQFRAETSA